MAVALILGGGRNPGHALVIGLASALALAFAVSEPARGQRGSFAPFGWIALGIVAILAVIQLFPLSMSFWAGLPGRGLPAHIADLAGWHGRHALSLDPSATLSSLVALLPAMAMFGATLAATGNERRTLAWLIVGAAGLSVMLGALQAAGGDGFYLYSSTHFGAPVGLLANRNHQADLLLVAMLLLAWLILREGRGAGGRSLALLGGSGLFAIGVLASGSRVGIALLVPTILVILAMLARGRPVRRLGTMALCAAAIAVAGLLVVYLSPAAQDRLARFALLGEDLRYGIWTNTGYAVAQYWPVGSGLGTFVPVFVTVEPLDAINHSLVNHAHNDYLELLLETGIVGVLLIAGYAVFFVAALMRRLAPAHAFERRAVAAAILVLLVHSLTDYPLRTASLMCVFGYLSAVLAQSFHADRVMKRTASVSV